jgi:hypothetical protein
MNRNLARGLFLMAVALAFGLQALLHYPIGQFSHAGPGLFPFMVSCILLVIGIATVVRAFFVERVVMPTHFRNIVIVLGSLCGFALVSLFVNMIAGIIVLVFVSTIAGTSYSWLRNAKIAAVLIGIALALQYFLGLSLPLY